MNKTPAATKPSSVDAVLARTQDLVQRARQDLDALEQRLRAVRGTRNIRRPAKPAAAPEPPPAPADPDSPYYVGDDGPTDELLEAVRACITDRERSFGELVELTGARPNRIKGALVRLQRDEARVVNLGTETKALWRILSDDALDRVARVRPAKRRR